MAIVGIALGTATPLISKTMKHNAGTDIALQHLQNQIDDLRRNQSNVEDGAVMFYATENCPENWAKINGFGGHYLRIQNDGETIGSVKEQMVHRHKHVSPYISFNNSTMSNSFRYGPFAPDNEAEDDPYFGDIKYPKANFNFFLGGPSYPGASYSNWYLYTSDGMNRTETLSKQGLGNYTILTCPNRDEGDAVCKPSGNEYDIPYLTGMPLVGNENRPNSLVLTACVKGYNTCTMTTTVIDGRTTRRLNCTR